MHKKLNCLAFLKWIFQIWFSESALSSIFLNFMTWGPMTHICVSKLTIIGSDNGLSPGRCQAIIWTIVGILLIGPLGTKFSEISIAIHTFSFKKMHLKMCGKCRPFCPGINVSRVTIYLVTNEVIWGFIITPASTKLKGGRVCWFHLVHLSVCRYVRPSVRLSIRPSVCLSVDRNGVRSVSSTILIRSISYLHILSSNFKRCVTCNICFKIMYFGKFFKFVTLTLSSFELGSNMTQCYG